MKPVSRLLEPLRQRIMLLVARSVLKIVNDDPGLQRVQVAVLAKETRDNVERFQQYGFSSHPLPGAEGICLFMAGNRDHPVVVSIDDRRYRPRGLDAGETILYTFEDEPEGRHRFHLKNNQDAELNLGRDLLNEIGRDVTENVGRDVTQDVGRNETITVGETMKIEAGTKIELVCGASKIVLYPDRIRVFTPDYEANQA